MKELTSFGVQELDSKEIELINGGILSTLGSPNVRNFFRTLAVLAGIGDGIRENM